MRGPELFGDRKICFIIFGIFSGFWLFLGAHACSTDASKSLGGRGERMVGTDAFYHLKAPFCPLFALILAGRPLVHFPE